MNKCTANLSKSHLYQKDAQKGFTLIEMMVVIAIMAILASIAVPSFTKQLAQQRTQQSAMSILSVFNKARANAALSNQQATIAIDDTHLNYSIIFLNRAETTVDNPVNKTVNHYKLDNQSIVHIGIGAAANTTTVEPLVASSSGGISKPTYFRVCDGVGGIQGYTLWINGRGIAKYQAGPIGGVGNDAITQITC